MLEDKNQSRQRDCTKANVNSELKRILKIGSLCSKALFTKEIGQQLKRKEKKS
jgi:hypothetical protein